MPQAITTLISSVKAWLAAHWPSLGNSHRIHGNAAHFEPVGNGHDEEPEHDGELEHLPRLEPIDVPPYPGWLRSESGIWLDPNAKFIHLEDLLDQIPICQKLLKALLRHDSEAYEYHRRIGARLVSHTSGFLWHRLSDDAKEIMPTTGLVYFHEKLSERDDEDSVPMMIYFDKQALNLWSYHGTAYKVTLTYWLRHRRHSLVELKRPFAIGGRYTVVVDDAGKALAVPEPTTITQKIRHRDALARHTGHHMTQLAQSVVAIPNFLRTIYEDRPVQARRGQPLEEWAGSIAAYAINATTAGVNAKQFMVLAERNGVTARFDVGLSNPKQFFKDRNCALAADGKRKRIVHWVNRFERIRDGKKSSVRGHCRGLTEFAWHGSKITVLVPENLMDPRKFDVPLYELGEFDELPPGMAPMSEMAEELKKKMLEYGDKKHAIE